MRAYSNCEEVELFLNGRSLGRQKMEPVSELKWKVNYAPGTLSAKAYQGGNVVAETKVETTGAPAAVQLAPERAALNADGEDLAIVTVSVADAQGRLVPTAGNAITFTLEGPGRIIGVGNGDPSCHEPDTYVATTTSRALPIDGWRWKKIADAYAKDLPEVAESFDDAAWAAIDVNTESGPLGPQEKAVFRTKFTVSATNLASAAVELRFGKIAGGGHVYLNGKQIAPTGDSRMASVYDVKALLRPGENTVAVAIANYGTAGGVNQGVQLRLQDKPMAPQWSRSVFNGLAQIIIRTTKEPGTLKLTARAEGLTPATLALPTQPVTARPAVR